MAYCGKCGASNPDGLAFCTRCGAPVVAGGTANPVPAPVTGPDVTAAGTGMKENVAGLLCYVLGWLTGLIFLLIDKRPFVRFHAAQSIVVFGTLFIIRMVLSYGWVGFHSVFTLWSLVSLVVSLVTLILWILLMVTAFQGKRFEIPVAASLAKSIAGSTTI